MQVRSVHHISLIVADTERALRFYHELLGLAQIERPKLGFPGAWLGVGEQQIHLLELPNPDPAEGRPKHVGRDRHLALAVEGLEEYRQKLEQAGVECIPSRSGRSALFCRDPDGNGIELVGIVAN